jgi:hypothetical protein
MKTTCEIEEKIKEFKKYATQEWSKMEAEKDIYKKLPFKLFAEKFENAAKVLEWVLGE